MPSKIQINSIGPDYSDPSTTYVSSFSPVLGGRYFWGLLHDESTLGSWMSSEAYGGTIRYLLRFDGTSLYTSSSRRDAGYYIRCIQAS
ncbi:hypothetical protein IKF84_01590 [Candidatus Saccharibacteria bacterium]|nr:hypothetical protein [Candidatus Saccharibacteria bacterium]